jgi:hypothetical protein
MNISLSPNDTLGRMLHTFSCTAYEVSDYNFDNLVNLKLLTLPNTNANSLRIGQVNLKELIATKNESDLLFADKYPDFTVTGNIINLPSVFHANITEATPGTIIGLNFANG